MLGFRGSDNELAVPETNIRYGVTYLARAWRLAEGDLCRALMKYRAGYSQTRMTSRSVEYCGRAKIYLRDINSTLAMNFSF
jgi:soluble lytic murein transglycosylase-like protein